MADASEGVAAASQSRADEESSGPDAVPAWRLLLNRAHVRGQIAWLTLRYRLVLRAVSLGTLFSLIGLVPLALEVAQGNSLKLSADLPVVLVIVAGAGLAAWLITSMLSYRRSAQRFRNIVKSAEERQAQRDELVLAPSLVEAGYVVEEFRLKNGDVEYFATSDSINHHLASGTAIVVTMSSEAYELPESVRPFVPGLLRRLLHARTIVHNGKLVGLRSEITSESKDASIQRSRYLEAQSSDEIIDRLLWDIHDIEPQTDGRRLVVDQSGALKPLHLTAATNHIGVSTLVVTSDDFVFFQRQGSGSNVNQGRWAPSGSGSVDLRDWQVVRRRARRGDAVADLSALLSYAAEREFIEEFGLDGIALPALETSLIGMARLIERGGHPDFFAVTRIPMTKGDLEHLASRRAQVRIRERGLSEKSKHPVRVRGDLGATVSRFLETEPNQSIQNHIFGRILNHER